MFVTHVEKKKRVEWANGKGYDELVWFKCPQPTPDKPYRTRNMRVVHSWDGQKDYYTFPLAQDHDSILSIKLFSADGIFDAPYFVVSIAVEGNRKILDLTKGKAYNDDFGSILSWLGKIKVTEIIEDDYTAIA